MRLGHFRYEHWLEYGGLLGGRVLHWSHPRLFKLLRVDLVHEDLIIGACRRQPIFLPFLGFLGRPRDGVDRPEVGAAHLTQLLVASLCHAPDDPGPVLAATD